MTHTPDRLRAAAQAGDNAVRLQLADRLLDEHQPLDFDPFEALYWLEQAATDGDVQALLRSGTMWGTGLGCDANPETARVRFETAAAGGDRDALVALAYCREHGFGGARDPAAATIAYQRAAIGGDATALACLAWRHESGHTLDRDPTRAARCWSLAAAAGHPTAGERLRLLGAPAGNVAPDMTPDLAEAAPDPARALAASAPPRQIVAWEPRAFCFPGFLSEDECLHLVAAAQQQLKPSQVVRSSGRQQRFEGRTSGEMAFVAPHKTIVVWNIEQRIARQVLLPAEHGEPMVILRYGPGDEYVTHTDYCDPSAPGAAEFLQRGGQRVATFLVYLNDVPAGGETEFQLTGASVKPHRAMGFLFWNVRPDGSIDPNSRHAGVPVREGQKWLASKWIREFAPVPLQPKNPRYAVQPD